MKRLIYILLAVILILICFSVIGITNTKCNNDITAKGLYYADIKTDTDTVNSDVIFEIHQHFNTMISDNKLFIYPLDTVITFLSGIYHAVTHPSKECAISYFFNKYENYDVETQRRFYLILKTTTDPFEDLPDKRDTLYFEFGSTEDITPNYKTWPIAFSLMTDKFDVSGIKVGDSTSMFTKLYGIDVPTKIERILLVSPLSSGWGKDYYPEAYSEIWLQNSDFNYSTVIHWDVLPPVTEFCIDKDTIQHIFAIDVYRDCWHCDVSSPDSTYYKYKSGRPKYKLPCKK